MTEDSQFAKQVRRFSDWLDRTSKTKEGVMKIAVLTAGAVGLGVFLLILAF